MKNLGTILPTAASLKCDDDYAKRVTAENLAFGKKALPGIEPIKVNGETRYYKTDKLYAVVSKISKQTVRWFEVRADGDYSVKQ